MPHNNIIRISQNGIFLAELSCNLQLYKSVKNITSVLSMSFDRQSLSAQILAGGGKRRWTVRFLFFHRFQSSPYFN